MKKVLIVMSERTGTGHKSAANAIEKRLKNKGYEVKQLDAFPLMGKKGIKMEDSYIPMTLKTPHLYSWGYTIEQKIPNTFHHFIYKWIKKELVKEINSYNPDLIITVHSLFTKAISLVLKDENKNIPLYVCVVDLVDPPGVWFNKLANKTFVPTYDVKDSFVKKGMDEKDVIYYGFPSRDDIVPHKNKKEVKDKINILLVNPSVILKKNIEFAKEVSKIENANVSFICGRDEELYNALIKAQKDGKINSKINVQGFVTNMNDYLNESHILLTKAGPNMMIEAVRSGTAVVVTGHISGQENTNYKFITQNNLGFKCENTKKIFEKLNDFIGSNKLNDCLDNLYTFDIPNGADIVCDYIVNNL